MTGCRSRRCHSVVTALLATRASSHQKGANSVAAGDELHHKTAARRTAGAELTWSLALMRCRYNSTVL